MAKKPVTKAQFQKAAKVVKKYVAQESKSHAKAAAKKGAEYGKKGLSALGRGLTNIYKKATKKK